MGSQCLLVLSDKGLDFPYEFGPFTVCMESSYKPNLGLLEMHIILLFLKIELSESMLKH